jgi:hypothetical protein
VKPACDKLSRGQSGSQGVRLPSRRWAIAWLWLLAGLGALPTSGCVGYRMGSRTLYRGDIRTVYVPVVRNDSFRAQLGTRLTEAIQKEIELRTPYKVVSDPTADSILSCLLTFDDKQVLGETQNDDPRYLRTSLAVQVNWTDRRGGLLMENRILPPGELAFFFGSSAAFTPEAGQSISTAQQRAIEQLAAHIVGHMETRW